MIELRDYQMKCAADCEERIRAYNIAYLAAEVRTGKTLTSLTVADNMEFKHVLFVTKKMAIESVKKDFLICEYDFKLLVTNYEQLKNIPTDHPFDFIIIDEAHGLGAFPIPTNRANEMKRIVGNRPILYLSGTPTPETYVQFYHQFWVSASSPWKDKKNFYYWAACGYVFKGTKYIANQKQVNDYSKPNGPKILADVEKYIVNLSQADAGFKQVAQEQILTVPLPDGLKELILTLKRDKIVTLEPEKDILGDVAVKMLSKWRQLASGTVIFESGEAMVVSLFKAKFIKERFAGKKIAIYYVYTAEGDALKMVFPNWTNSQEEFNNSDPEKVFICQAVAGREGVNLRAADCIVAYNIDHSATTYWQFRQRHQYMERDRPLMIYWIFSEGINGKKSIEQYVHEAVSDKKNYTSKFFERDMGLFFEKKNDGRLKKV